MLEVMQKSKSQRGFSLIEILVVMGLSSIVMTGAGFLILDAKKSEKKAQDVFWLQEKRLEIQRSVQSDGKWAGIKAANTNMSCFDAGTSCSAFITPQKLKLPVNNDIIDGNNPALGLTPNATFCYAFNPTNGNDACPYGLDMTWKAVCDTADCRNAQPRIDIKFKTKSQNSPTAVQNLNSFNITAFKDSKTQNINDVCISMGGTYSGTTCNIPSASALCDPSNSSNTGATFPIGFAADGKVQCGIPKLDQCPTDQVVIGFDNSGNVICAPKCANGPSVVNCKGTWSTCSQTCGSGIQTYTIGTPPSNGGSACEAINGKTRTCNTQTCGTATDCQGSWSICTGCPGQQTFSILNQAQNGGAACVAAHNAVQSCSNGACSTAPVNCQGAWGSCDQNTGLETYVVTTPAQNGGAACTATSGQTRSCSVDCIGYWDNVCQGTAPSRYVVYIVTVPKQGAGLACPYANGAQDTDGTSGYLCNGSNPPPPPPAGSCIRLMCFVAGTKVKMANGKNINIENIKSGDQVLSYDERTKKQRIDTVDHPTIHEASWQILHRFELANGVQFTSNDVHPFYVVEKDQYFEAQEILKMLENKEKISFLSDENKPVKIQKITVERKFVPVYNLGVKGLAKSDSKYGKYGRGHNYFVHGILTHNKYPRNADGSCPGGSYPAGSTGGACAFCPDTRPNYDGIGIKCCP